MKSTNLSVNQTQREQYQLVQYVFKSIGIYLARRKSIFTNLGEETEDRALLRDFNVHYFKSEKERRANEVITKIEEGPDGEPIQAEQSEDDAFEEEKYFSNAMDADNDPLRITQIKLESGKYARPETREFLKQKDDRGVKDWMTNENQSI